uniref:DUF4050 domain-containing protein n=1 Tax=Panagrolaimus sp. PS1159 TaxID=55785 RepID=A0AC35G845_9BILA
MFSMNSLSHDIQCSDYSLDHQQQQQQPTIGHELNDYQNFEQIHEKPPLTAIGEVIELIGNEWNSNNEYWKNNTNHHNIQLSICHFCAHPIQERFLLKVN